MVFSAFYEHNYHGLVNSTAHILHTIKKKSIHHHCRSLLNKKKLDILSKSLQKETSVYATN